MGDNTGEWVGDNMCMLLLQVAENASVVAESEPHTDLASLPDPDHVTDPVSLENLGEPGEVITSTPRSDV